jgi:exosome complex RNA-binding protein Rrp4
VLLFYFRDDFQYVRSHDETQMVRMGGSVLFVHQFCQFSAVGRHQTDFKLVHVVDFRHSYVLPPEPTTNDTTMGNISQLNDC